MKGLFRSPKSISVIVSVLLAIMSITILGFTAQNTPPGCREVRGSLFNAIAGEELGRMIGTISGDYWINLQWDSYDPEPLDPDTSVMFTWTNSYVEGKKGRIEFKEYAAIDLEEQYGTNGAVLLVVTGGTGIWENASGYITLSGYYHTNEQTGVWDYQGEVCNP